MAEAIPEAELAIGGNFFAPGSVVSAREGESGMRSQRIAKMEIDWNELRARAAHAAHNAYAPYSGLHVGAAGLAPDGRVFVGCNVENASYGLTLCAECGLISSFVAGGSVDLVAVSVVSHDGRPLMPCGRCRQLLVEHGSVGLLLDQGEGAAPVLLRDLLPAAWRRPEDVPSTHAARDG